MKASPRQQLLLLQLQDLDHALARLRRRREQIPERADLAALAGEMSAAKDAFMHLQRELDTQQAEIGRLESDVDLVQQRIRRDEQLIAESISPKEAQALQNELDTLARRRGELEDKELELMEANEQTQQLFDAASNELDAVNGKRQAIVDAISAAETAIDAEHRATADERAGLSAELQRDLLEHYEALRARHGIAVARLRGKISEASNMELAPAELSSIMSAAEDELVYCPQSGAILVREFDD